MKRYRLNGIPVTREQAVWAWHHSTTYLRAEPRTRGMIFRNADQGINTDGEIAHLAEAGITIERKPTTGDPR